MSTINYEQEWPKTITVGQIRPSRPHIDPRHLTSGEIFELLATPDIRAGAAGQLEALDRFVHPGNGVDHSPERRCTEELSAQFADAMARSGRRAEYLLDPTRRDDGSDWPGTGLRGERADVMLTSTDMVWLDRLSDDAANITAAEKKGRVAGGRRAARQH